MTARVRRGPPFSARTCDPSTEQSSRSSRPARRSSVNRAACRRGQTPASVQSRSRRQAVTPEQPTASAGTSRHATPVRSTYRTPASATRSGTRSCPGWRWRRSGAAGSSGATRSHRSSGTRSARTPDTVPTKIVERKTHGSTHSETISKPPLPGASEPNTSEMAPLNSVQPSGPADCSSTRPLQVARPPPYVGRGYRSLAASVGQLFEARAGAGRRVLTSIAVVVDP